MSIYYDLLSAAYTRLTGDTSLAAYTIVMRPDPIFYRDVDSAPLIIVSPRRNQQERFVDGFFDINDAVQGPVGAMVDHPVLVTFVFVNNKDEATVQVEMDVREKVRNRLYVPVSPAFYVDYDPTPGASAQGLSDPLDSTQQEFRYRVAL